MSLIQLIEKQQHCLGIDGTVLSWLICYLQSRQFFVKLDDVTSKNVQLFSGVLQESVLGLLLFDLYSQKIENIALGHNIVFMYMLMTFNAILVLIKILFWIVDIYCEYKNR